MIQMRIEKWLLMCSIIFSPPQYWTNFFYLWRSWSFASALSFIITV